MKFTRLFVTIITLFAFAAACGGGESGDQQSATETGQQEVSDDIRTINLIGLDGMKFAVEGPAEGITVSDTLGANQELRRLETITVEPGEQIRVVLTTRSQLPPVAMAHNWALLTMEADATAFIKDAIKAKANDYLPPERKDEVIASTGLAAGGETTEVTFTAPETPGEYEYVCSFPGHFSAGMRGTLVVQSGESGGEMAE